MTVVHAQIMRPDASGTPKPGRGYLRWRPVRGWSTNGNALVLPVPFRVKLVAGSASVTVEPSTADWAWEVTYELLGQPHEKRVYAVPASGTTLELTALTEVSPVTGTPAEPLPANWAVVLPAAVATAVAAAVPGLVAEAVSAALGTLPRTVIVVTGSEARPSTSGSVSWIGGTDQPVNMADGDLWFKALP